MKDKELRSQVIELAFPAVLQGLLSTIILFTDRLILGWYSDAALASMQVSAPVLWSIFSLFGAYGVGVLAVIGRSTGAGDHVRAGQTLGTALCIALILGTVVGFLGYLGAGWITDLIVGTEHNGQAKDMANVYLSTVFLSGPLMMVGSVTFVAFQASGDTKTPMWITGIAGLCNLGLSWALVFGSFGLPELGILGAAIGTISASVCNSLLGVLVMIYKRDGIRLKFPRWSILSLILKVAFPAFGEKLLFHIGFLIFAGYVGRLGEAAMTAQQALMAIESLGYIVANAFGIAAGALVAQKLGSKEPEAAMKAAIISAKLGTIVLCAIGLFFFLCARPLIGLFTDNIQIIALAFPCMVIAAFAQPLMALTDVFAGSLRGAGDTKNPMKVALVGPLLVRLFACWFLAFYCDLGLLGIWLGSTLDWAVRAIWLWIVFARGEWMNIKI